MFNSWGYAEQFAEIHAGRYLYRRSDRRWLVLDGEVWTLDQTGRIIAAVQTWLRKTAVIGSPGYGRMWLVNRIELNCRQLMLAVAK